VERNIFEYAAEKKLRFPFKGKIKVEDLYDLGVEDLDSIYKTLMAQSKQTKEESLLTVKSSANVVLDTMIEIVKHIVTGKIEATKNAEKRKENADKKQKLMSILSDKQDETLRNMSEEEIKAMLDKMGS